MTQESDTSEVARPRVITVAGVIWLYVGSLWILTGLFSLGGFLYLQSFMTSMARMGGSRSFTAELPSMFWWFPLGVAAIGLVATFGAWGLLKLQEKGRKLVEIASWSAAAFILLFTFSWMDRVTTSYSAYGTFQTAASWPQVRMALFGLVVGVLSAAPFLVIARKLRSQEARRAMRVLPYALE